MTLIPASLLTKHSETEIDLRNIICSPTVFVFVIVYFLNKCLIITLIKCFKGDMSLGVLYSSVFNNVLGLSMTR